MRRGSKITAGLLAVIILVVTLVYTVHVNEPTNNDGMIGIRDLKLLINAPEGDVDFLFWVNKTSDALAAKDFYSRCRGPQLRYYQLGDDLVDEKGCPRQETFGNGKYLVLFGGPSVQPVVKFYEDNSQTPVVISFVNATHFAWTTRQHEVISKDIMSVQEFDLHHDTFMFEFFVDNYGRKVFVSYGWNWQGTVAAVTYLVKVVIPSINDYKNPYYTFRWADTDNDCIPEPREIIEERPKYVSIQAVLHWTANPQVVEWFANACHSRGLNVTWYVDPIRNQNLTEVLKQYVHSGDSVQLSFSSVFFNEMTPTERLLTVNEHIIEFQRQLGFYPSLIEAYYIDAFTLNYVASRFPFVKGAVGYVNHEEFCDGLKTAGGYYMPYYPSKLNSMVPGKGANKIPIVILPFVERDISNNILHNDVRYNLSPQDAALLVDNWQEYFGNLFSAYLNGWDQFGLASYLVDLTYAPLPEDIVERDLSFIRDQIEQQNCKKILDEDLVKWFGERFADSPCYRWMYNDPIKDEYSSTWYFTDKQRTGWINNSLIENREFLNEVEEGCYFKRVYPYENLLAVSTIEARFLGFNTELVQNTSQNHATLRGRDGASAYDFWNYPRVSITADVTGAYEIVWSYNNTLDGKLVGSSGGIANTVYLAAGQIEEVQLKDNRDSGYSGRNPNRGESIAYGVPDLILDGAWHSLESTVDVNVRSPSGAIVFCRGKLSENFRTPVP